MSGVASSSSVVSKKKKSNSKKSSGSRPDIGWEHGIDIDNNAKRSQCKYCSKFFSGGVYRLKNHLAGTNENVIACLSVLDDVKTRMIENLATLAEIKEKKKRKLYDTSGSMNEAHPGFMDHASKGKEKASSYQTTMNQLLKKDLRKSACKRIAKWFYTSGIPFNTVKNPEFERACEEIARHGPGFKGPSYHEIRETFLTEEVKEIDNFLDVNKDEWSKIGCTIMSDAEKVFEMLDKIVDKVGEENVVQVITDNAASYKAAGSLLMEKRKNLFWTPCAAHCIDLMLEDFEKKLQTHRVTIRKGRKITTFIYNRPNLISSMKNYTKGRDLIRPAVTRFATAYLTLGCLSEHKGSLITMFSSSSWKGSTHARSEKGKKVQKIVLDNKFWSNVVTCLRAALPLIKVLRLVDSDEQPAMPFLYEEMDCAKEKIQNNFNNVKSREVKNGLFDSIDKLVKDRFERHTIITQLDAFHHAQGMFSREDARALLGKNIQLIGGILMEMMFPNFKKVNSDDEWITERGGGVEDDVVEMDGDVGGEDDPHGFFDDGNPLDESDASEQDVDEDEDEERERSMEMVEEDESDDNESESDDGLDPNVNLEDLS
ncbi:PREDICTED: uncharacterized protein LOC105972480 [Erythranthe guttata]|uniref:uncharacterized protein LOC105972480 n=1 Tax=Erythranthe guttata TaxID=4155 RepID=UPI00064DA39D|nr:PREDICTED: uncharacterized protein LOC105972480 [Erythranthe guttata]|eukprot:XP_012852896.1 PREDICTED: uncharacterized protein LOC105972480 [Erythranthe guttata]